MRDLDPTTRFCTYTGEEFLNKSYHYGVNFDDPVKVAFNFIYRFGNIYDAVKPVIPYFSNSLMTRD